MNVRPGQMTRQQLYDRIRESSKDEVILDEMIRLGFWPSGDDAPNEPDEIIRRRTALRKELAELSEQNARWSDPEAAVKEMHKQRKKAARERREETKRRNAQARHDRAVAWHERSQNDLLYLGDEVSIGLFAPDSSPKPLKTGLPSFETPRAVADAMGVPLAELRFLAYDRALARVHHYQRFTIAKKTGGVREISAPMPRLKRAQYWILDNILTHVPVHDAAHGFVPGRSILTNAHAHVGRDVVVNLDLKDFFPTLTLKRVKGKFRGLGYAEPVATVLALLCTEPDVDELELDGERLFAARGPRRLPQGAPTSPALTNLICAQLDARLSGLARSLDFTYTRYADDMTFSASGDPAQKVGALLRFVQEIVTGEGFTIHPDKTRIMRKGARQEVTGLIVNERIAVPRDVLRRFRALLHRIETTGSAGKRWGKAHDVMDAAHGFACFVRMVTPEIGNELLATVHRLEKGQARSAAEHRRVADFRAKSARGETPLEQWWTPESRPAPQPEPILLKPQQQPEPEKAARPTASALGNWGRFNANAEAPRVSEPPPPEEADEKPRLNPWVAALGVVVLVNTGFAINPLLGLMVFFAALYIGIRRLIRRRKNRKRT